jgi:hypothetical protein
MALSLRAPRAASFAAFLNLFSGYDESWLRERLWGPMQALLTIFALVEPGRDSSYQSACETAHAWAHQRFDWDRLKVPHPSGFKRARDRVTEDQCAKLLSSAQALGQASLKRRKSRRFDGRPLAAFDGSALHMRRSTELVREYGVPKDSLGIETCHYPQARLMSAWDLERRIPLAWELGSHTDGERAMALGLLERIPEGAICIFDRGFPGREFFGEILDSGRDFVARMVASQVSAWAEVSAFLASGKRSAIVTVVVGSGARRREVRLRLVRRVFDAGRPAKHQKRELMVVISSLTDECRSSRDLCRLYGERWGIEVLYRELKALAEVERWHGETKALVRQEIFLLLVWFCFAAILADDAHQSRPPTPGKEPWRANTRRVFTAVARVMEALIASIADPLLVADLMRRADVALYDMCRWMLRRRPGRSYPRVPLHPYARRL